MDDAVGINELSQMIPEVTDLILPWIGVLISIVIFMWFKDFASQLAKGLAFKHDPHFQEGDLVLRVDQHTPHKLAPSWEGPFIVTKVLHNGAYRLYNVEHNIDEPRAWNAELLRPFYT